MINDKQNKVEKMERQRNNNSCESERTKRDGKLLKLTLGVEQVTGKIIQFILKKCEVSPSLCHPTTRIQSVRGDGDKNVY